MLIPCKGEKCISTIHQVTGDERVRINNRRQGVGSRTSDEADYKEDLPTEKFIMTLELQCHCNRREREREKTAGGGGSASAEALLHHCSF